MWLQRPSEEALENWSFPTHGAPAGLLCWLLRALAPNGVKGQRPLGMTDGGWLGAWICSLPPCVPWSKSWHWGPLCPTRIHPFSAGPVCSRVLRMGPIVPCGQSREAGIPAPSEKAEFLRRDEVPPNPRLCPREAHARQLQTQKPPRSCASLSNTPEGLCCCSVHSRRTKPHLSVCLLTKTGLTTLAKALSVSPAQGRLQASSRGLGVWAGLSLVQTPLCDRGKFLNLSVPSFVKRDEISAYICRCCGDYLGSRTKLLEWHRACGAWPTAWVHKRGRV